MEEIFNDINLSPRVIKSGIWVLLIRVVYQFFFFIRLIVLARLLSPKDFGLMGIALLALTILDTFTQTGFQAALIQRKENTRAYLNTAWTVSVIRGIALFALLVLAAPLVFEFFNEEGVIQLVRIIAVSYLAIAFTNVGIIYFSKDLDFKKQFIFQTTGFCMDLVVSIILAFILRNALALVFGFLAGSSAKLVLSYWLHPFKPRIEYDRSKAKELFHFGKWVLWSKILVYTITQLDSILLGKLFGAKILGYYQLGNRISNTPTTEITHVISSVAFPAYARIQHNIIKLREGYLRVMKLVAFLSFPLAAFLLTLVKDFTSIFLGEKWMPIVPVTKVLIFAGLFRALSASSGSILYAVGKPKLDSLWQFIRLITLVILIVPLTMRWDFIGTGIAVVMSNIVASIGLNYHVIKITCTKIKIINKLIMIPFFCGLIMIFPISMFKFVELPKMLSFFICLGIGAISYLTLSFIADRYLNYGIIQLIKNLYSSIKKKT